MILWPWLTVSPNPACCYNCVQGKYYLVSLKVTELKSFYLLSYTLGYFLP